MRKRIKSLTAESFMLALLRQTEWVIGLNRDSITSVINSALFQLAYLSNALNRKRTTGVKAKTDGEN